MRGGRRELNVRSTRRVSSLRRLPAMALAAALLGSQAAGAAFVLLPGWNFDLRYDDAQAGIATFGAPVLNWNTIFFVPSDFSAQSSNGGGLDVQSGSVTFELIAKPTVAFDRLLMTARGDYRLIGADSAVSVSGSLSASNPLAGTQTSALAVSPSTPLALADGALHPWQADAETRSGPGSSLGLAPTTLSVTLSSTLSAVSSGNPSLAFIQQKFTGELVELQVQPSTEVTPVPLPAGLYLMAAGIATLGALVRRKPH